MTKRSRIVVTGLGVVSCYGNDVDLFYNSLLEGKSGISTITGFPCEDLATKFAGEIRDFDPSDYMDKKQARRVDKCIAYGIVAAKRAVASAGLDEETLKMIDLERCGAIVGSGMGGMSVFVDGVETKKDKGAKRVSPFFIPYILTNMSGALFAMDLGFMGPNYSISTACATGNHSIIAAANHIRLGDADVMVCGGIEAAIMPMGIAGFNACKALSQRNDEPELASRPWDQGRDGFVMGEGAGILILERLEHALERGAPIIAEYLGHGISCDAYHMTEPRPDGKGVAKCIFRALDDAGLKPGDINYVNAHATSTPAGDMVEVRALKQVFEDPSKVVMNATKSMIGHSLGAAAGIEAVVTVKAIAEGKVHPTINLDNPEPGLEFQIPTQCHEMNVNAAISNSFGFGGHNATIILGKYQG
jgi:3-oxoacyl-[acyl-carrier-protein] synthase II